MLINSFDGKHAFLSNFFESPIIIEEMSYPTAEHAFQAMKTLDINMRMMILNCQAPGQAKRMGRRLALRSDWEIVKFDIMRMVVSTKFEQHPELMKLLIETGDSLLIEGNLWHDNTWGICYCPDCDKISGKNMLGIILMEIRDANKTIK